MTARTEDHADRQGAGQVNTLSAVFLGLWVDMSGERKAGIQQTAGHTQTHMYSDLLAYMGEAVVGTQDAFSQQMAEYARTSKVEPLPADLKVESGYGNRLFVVTSSSGKAPIQAASKEIGQDGKPKWRWEIGSYWIHRPDGWFVIRQ
jgi:hypothetical protein